MKTIKLSICKIGVLMSCLLVSGWAQGYTHANPTDEMYICVFETDLSPEVYSYIQQSYKKVFDQTAGSGICFTEKKLVPVYDDLTSSLKSDPANEALKEARSLLLETLIISFMHPTTQPLFYRALREQIDPVAKRILQGSHQDIEDNSIAWQDLQAFLAFYAQQENEEYDSDELFDSCQKQFIDDLYRAIEGKSNSRSLNANFTDCQTL
jgi:hypothetical protein